jgi:CBS domain-containing protein
MLVKKIMSETPATCHVDTTCSEAAKLMWDRDCGVIPVVDDQGKIMGMITDRDICMACYLQGKLTHQIQVREVMSKQVHSCKPEDTLEEAEAIMQQNQVRRLPVVDSKGQLVGLLSLNDIARATADRKLGKEADPRLLSQVLASICQPRQRSTQPLPS